MNESLDDYISHKPTLQAAILDATTYNRRYRDSKHQRTKNSEELKVESRKYICTEMDLLSNVPEKSAGNRNQSESGFTNPFEESFLALDLNEGEEFDIWCEELNSNMSKRQDAVSTEVNANFINDNKTRNNVNVNTPGASFENILNPNNSKQCDLRKLSKNQNSAQHSHQNLQQLHFIAPNAGAQSSNDLAKNINKNNNNYNNNNRRKQPHWSDSNNRFSVNNAPYQKCGTNRQFGNSNTIPTIGPNLCASNNNSKQLYHNQNMNNHFTGNNVRAGPNSVCSFYNSLLPPNVTQNYECNRNVVSGLNFNVNASDQANLLLSIYNALICNNNAAALNAPLRLNSTGVAGGNCNGDLNGYSNGVNTNFWNNAAGCSSNSNTPKNRFENNVNKILKLIGGGAIIKHNNNSGSNSKIGVETMNSADLCMEGNSNKNNLNSSKAKSIGSLLNIKPQELEVDSVPALLFLMQYIFENGIQIPSINNDEVMNQF